jgi:hypothetical protein
MRWVSGFFAAVIIPLLVNEFADLCPWLAERLIRGAVRLLPKEHQERYRQEWHAEIYVVPGKLTKLAAAISILVRAPTVGHVLQTQPDVLERVQQWLVRIWLGVLRSLLEPLTAALQPRSSRTKLEKRAYKALAPGNAYAPVVSISGMPGVGKTMFAQRLAHKLAQHQYPDGQTFVRLGGYGQPHRSAADALYKQLVALGVPHDEIPDSIEHRRRKYLQALAGKRALVIMDDATAAEQVLALWPPIGSAAIVTCRVELLELIAEGALPVRLRPLTTLEAFGLLANRIGRTRVAREPVAALRLVNACGRLPLALGLVTARLSIESGSHMSLSDVVARLQHPYGGNYLMLGADQSVVTALSASYERLNDEQRLVFHVIGVLDINEVEAEVVAAAADMPLEQAEVVLHELVDANLLEVAGRSGNRWQMHRLVRLYADYIARRLR